MRKKYVVTTVAMLAAVSMLTACGNKENNANPTSTPTPTVTVAPTQTPDENGTDEPAPTPDIKPEAVDHAQVVNNIYQAVVEAYGGAYRPQMQVQEESYFMQDTLKLDASWYDAAIVEVPMMTMNVDMFAIVHATEGNLDNVKKAFDDYKNYLVNDSFQYPMNMPKVQSAVVEVLNDEYVVFSILSGLAYVDDVEEEGALITLYEESSKVAVDIAAGVLSGEIEVEPWTEIDMVRNAIVKAYGNNYWPNMKVHDDKEYLATYMTDTLKLDATWVQDIIIEVPMISTNVDTLILVKATEGNTENVLQALQNYKTYLAEETLQYPMNVARIQTAVVQQVGDYVCFSILGGVLSDPESYGLTTDEAIAEYYEQNSMNAIYAIQSYFGIWE